MKKTILLVTALLLGFVTMQANPVDVAKAQRLGQQFIQNKTTFAKQAVNQQWKAVKKRYPKLCSGKVDPAGIGGGSREAEEDGQGEE